VLFAGPKGAGKTTLLAHLGATSGGAIVTNDCALVMRVARASWEVRPVPISISVRPDTLTLLPDLFRDLADVETLMHYTVAEGAAELARSGRVTEPRRVRLSPAAFARTVGGRLSPGGRLVAVALLTSDARTCGGSIRRLPGDESERQLRDVRYGARSCAETTATVFASLVGGSTSAPEAVLLAHLAAEVPCYAVTVGPDVLDGTGAGRALLDELLGS
jgi:hypothetical protein